MHWQVEQQQNMDKFTLKMMELHLTLFVFLLQSGLERENLKKIKNKLPTTTTVLMGHDTGATACNTLAQFFSGFIWRWQINA